MAVDAGDPRQAVRSCTVETSAEAQDQLSQLHRDGYLLLGAGQVREFVDAALGDLSHSVDLIARGQSATSSWTLSDLYGRGQFPWHTDGAISSRPPRWVLLEPVSVGAGTPTELLSLPDYILQQLRRTVLRMRDRKGLIRYLPACVPSDNGVDRIRWDLRIGQTSNQCLANEISNMDPSFSIDWRREVALIFDNFRLLHRRGPVTAKDERVIRRSYVWER